MKSFLESAKAANLLYELWSRALTGRDGASAHRRKLARQFKCSLSIMTKSLFPSDYHSSNYHNESMIFVRCRSKQVPGETTTRLISSSTWLAKQLLTGLSVG